MHDYFAAWLSGVYVQLTDDVARSRWAAVEVLVQRTTESGKAVRLAASAVAVASVSVEQRREVAEALQEGDASFPMINNDAELQVLAASAIVQLLKDEGAVADAAALGVVTGTFGDREPESAPGLALLAQDYLNRRALSVRVRVETPRRAAFTSQQVSALTKLSKDVSEALVEDRNQGTVSPDTLEILNNAVSKLTAHVRRVAEAEFDASNRLSQDHGAFSEENNILWWVISGYSRELSKPRDQASPAELTLPSARELASLATRGVSPAASIEYLRHALSSAKGEAPQLLTVMAAIKATAPEWRASATSVELPEGTDRLFPILVGLRVGGEVLGGSDWSQALWDRTGLAADFADTPEQIGLHFLNELSLANCLASSEPGQA